MVYLDNSLAFIGIPEITPEFESKVNPSGNGGFICQVSGPSPKKLGVKFYISCPTISKIDFSP